MSYPKYVRLADHLSRGMRADIQSGFSISGLDVVEAPDQEASPRQAAFVKRELAAGRLEAASKAEFDEVHPDLLETLGYEVERKVTVTATPQEAHVQREARKAGAALRASRESASSEDAYAADEERRAATIEAQQEAEKGSGGSKKSKKAQARAEAAEADAEAAEGQQ